MTDRAGCDRAVAAAYRRGVRRSGREVTLLRITGQAPRTATIAAKVPATVSQAQPDTREESRTGYSGSDLGGISQTLRQVVILEEDLRAARFPMPPAKNDRVVLVEGGEQLNVVEVDLNKRGLGGAIELQVAGVG